MHLPLAQTPMMMRHSLISEKDQQAIQFFVKKSKSPKGFILKPYHLSGFIVLSRYPISPSDVFDAGIVLHLMQPGMGKRQEPVMLLSLHTLSHLLQVQRFVKVYVKIS